VELLEFVVKSGNNEDHATAVLDRHIPLLSELVYCRATDSYLVFISGVLAAVFKAKPEILRSSEKVEVEFVLRHGSMDDLLSSLIENRVRELSFQGMADVAKYFDKRLNLSIFDDDTQSAQVIRIIATATSSCIIGESSMTYSSNRPVTPLFQLTSESSASRFIPRILSFS
jgi:hypothetical protein